MLLLILMFFAYIAFIFAKFFLLLSPIKYTALRAKRNAVYNTGINKFYKLYFIGTVILDLLLIILLPTIFGGLVLDILLIVVVFIMIRSKKIEGKPFRVLFPVYRNDHIGSEFAKFMGDHDDANYILAANQSPLFITSSHESDHDFDEFTRKLNEVDDLFEDLNSKKKRLLCNVYPVMIAVSLMYVFGFSFILSVISLAF